MATQQTKDGLGYIIQAISNIVEPKMETLKYDKTYRAKIVEEIEVGIYKVQINNVIYKLSYDGTLNVGDIVRVRAPLNNFSDIYIEPLPGSGGESGETTNYNDLANKPVINSTYSTSQTTNANETLKGTIALHKISKTGNYDDLLNKPSLNFIPTSQRGAADGVASLGADKIVPKSELPTDVVYDSNYKHITIENVLNSTSTTNALSAAQGKILNDKVEGIVVYESTGQSSGVITLTKDISSAKKIKIIYIDEYSVYGEKTIETPVGKQVGLNTIRNGAASFIFTNLDCTISANAITINSNKKLTMSSGVYSDATTKILKVIEY